MSPDIEWRLGDESGGETVAQTTRRPPSRWRRWLIALSIMGGVGLGMLYISTPGLNKPPSPTPEPTFPPPPPLDPVVAREVSALADGDRAAFLELQDQIDGEWYRAQEASFEAWGRPARGNPYDNPYIVASQAIYASGRAWVEVLQWRGNGEYVRETRFYRMRSGEWKRARPDPAFWSGRQWSGRTAHFEITYPAEDNRWVWLVTQRFERVYDVLCRDLNCPQRSNRTFRAVLNFQPNDRRYSIETGNGLTLTLPSPRLVGLFVPYGEPGDAYTDIAYTVLLDPISRLASGDLARWRTDHSGELFLRGLMAWQQLRIDAARATPPERTFVDAPGGLFTQPSQGDTAATQQFYRDLLADEKILPLPNLWHWPPAYTVTSDLGDLVDGEVDAFIAFIEQENGNAGVIRLLNRLGPAHSLEEAVGAAFAVKYGDLEQRWLNWIGK